MKNMLALFTIGILVSVMIFAGNGDKYGKKITITNKTSVSEILKHPENFDGKKVLIEGTIVGVCAKRGCWIDVASDKEGGKIRVKVEDGVIVFPMEVKGKKVRVEGEVYSIENTKDCSKEKTGCASENKESKGSCCSESKTTKIYQIKGTGAVVG
jgi:hypothetical protein